MGHKTAKSFCSLPIFRPISRIVRYRFAVSVEIISCSTSLLFEWPIFWRALIQLTPPAATIYPVYLRAFVLVFVCGFNFIKFAHLNSAGSPFFWNGRAMLLLPVFSRVSLRVCDLFIHRIASHLLLHAHTPSTTIYLDIVTFYWNFMRSEFKKRKRQ